MTWTVFALVLTAALLHASWNAMVKGGADKALAMAAVVAGQGLCGAVALIFAPVPDLVAWPYLLASVALHVGYQFFLMQSYRAGDFSQVYPIARGAAPLLVAAATALLLGARLGAAETAGVALISLGLMSLALTRRADGLRNGKAAALALTTGGFIAAYTVVDGLGARAAGTGLGFYAWSALINGLVFCAVIGVARPALLRALPSATRLTALGGGASFLAYALVVQAFTLAPIALVAALRETSIVFALLIGAVFFKERLNLAKLAATMAVLTGAALMRVGRS